MPGLVHQRFTACRFNRRRQTLRTFHIKQNGAARHAREHVLCKQHHLPVGVDVVAVLGDDTQPVAIAVEGQAQLGVAGFQRRHQIAQILGLAGIGVVVGKIAIDFAEKLDHFAAQRTENCRRRCTCNAVARINHDFHRAVEFDVASDAVAIGFEDVAVHDLRPHAYHCVCCAASRGGRAFSDPALFLHHRAKCLNLIAVNCPPSQHHFETVVVFRVVAASDLNAAAAQGIGRKIKHRRGDHANVDHVHTTCGQPADQRRAQGWATQSTITPHGHLGFSLAFRYCSEGPAQPFCHCLVDSGRHDAANVIGFEDGSVKLHKVNP